MNLDKNVTFHLPYCYSWHIVITFKYYLKNLWKAVCSYALTQLSRVLLLMTQITPVCMLS